MGRMDSYHGLARDNELAIVRIYAHHLYASFLDYLLSSINKAEAQHRKNKAMKLAKMDETLVKRLQLIFQTSGLGTQDEARFVVVPCFLAHGFISV